MAGEFVSSDHVVASPLVAGNVNIEFTILAFHGFIEDRFTVERFTYDPMLSFRIPPPAPFQCINFNFDFPVRNRLPVGRKHGSRDGDRFCQRSTSYPRDLGVSRRHILYKVNI